MLYFENLIKLVIFRKQQNKDLGADSSKDFRSLSILKVDSEEVRGDRRKFRWDRIRLLIMFYNQSPLVKILLTLRPKIYFRFGIFKELRFQNIFQAFDSRLECL